LLVQRSAPLCWHGLLRVRMEIYLEWSRTTQQRAEAPVPDDEAPRVEDDIVEIETDTFEQVAGGGCGAGGNAVEGGGSGDN
jgi:hypothetical protein